ncbi:helix-turn-helix transcriptional regulator [Paenibacillus roseipurpureus]|uniref:Helix-turn-helix domain-containing protein n=1 Tax=Paenibacillus roseopurpureus TaxID=2918901 RepID=A0AA96RIL8_9BACL|nr:helix-turn-helix domain-containing protein [Paenibacillus sp. MBLB1832]WNR42950.1 helix-turn-helix domain-containing protein [Paenibacillus sp. MBLB1832]
MRIELAVPNMGLKPVFCFPDIMGRYYDFPEHAVVRPQGALLKFNLHLVTAGRGYAKVDGKTYVLRPGDAFLYFPGQPQVYGSSKDEPWEVYWVHFYGSQLAEHLTELGFAQFPLWTNRNYYRMKSAFDDLIDEGDKGGVIHPARMAMLTYGVLAEFTMHSQSLAASRGSDAVHQILGLLQAMQDEACKPFVLEEWANRVGMGTHYFCRMFRKATQRTPMDFITLCRLRFAKQLLLEGKDLPVGEIAIQCGYMSTSYFIKRFRMQEGMTPHEYRRQFI